jgi:thioredoxin 1
MTVKILALILLISGSAPCQFPPPPAEGNPPFDSSDIIVDQILKSKIPVLIDFWAVWCMPCRMLSPTIEELKKKYAGRIRVMKVNVDVNARISAYFRVSSIPAVFFVKDKAVVLYLQGLRPKEDYESAIRQVLAMKPAQADSVGRTKGNAPGVPPADGRSDPGQRSKSSNPAKPE